MQQYKLMIIYAGGNSTEIIYTVTSLTASISFYLDRVKSLLLRLPRSIIFDIFFGTLFQHRVKSWSMYQHRMYNNYGAARAYSVMHGLHFVTPVIARRPFS